MEWSYIYVCDDVVLYICSLSKRHSLYLSSLSRIGLCYGYYANSQGSLNWFEVDLIARPAFSFKIICLLFEFITSVQSLPE